jgi:HprK-related kinase B
MWSSDRLTAASGLKVPMETRHPTKLDRLMHAVAEHHPLRATVELAINDFRVRIESNSEELILRLREYFRQHLTKIKDCDLMLVAIEASAPELGLPFKKRQRDPAAASGVTSGVTSGVIGRKEEYADVDGGCVVRKGETGLQFLLGPDMTLAVGACVENQRQIINLVNTRYSESVAQRG